MGSGCFGGPAKIGGESGPPDANGGRSGAVAFLVAAGGSVTSTAGSTGLAGTAAACGGLTGCAGTGAAGALGAAATEAAATGGRIAIASLGGGAITGGGASTGGASSLSPPLRSACGSSSIRYRATLGSSLRRVRIRRARSSSIELEWVFLSWTPRFGSASMIALGLTSSSLASSLIRILLIDGEKNGYAALASRP